MSDAITRVQVAPLEFTPEQKQMILTSFLNGASASEAAVLMELARVRRLNPITKQIHFVKRPARNPKGDGWIEVWAAQVGIDGFRAIAERTGLYDGQDEPEFEYDGKQIKLCRVRVYRKDWARPSVGVAHFSEYVQTKKDGTPNAMWASKPHIMLAKCAEALAFRKAFPEDTSGLHAAEELADEAERDATPPDQQPAPSSTAALKNRLKAQIVDVAPNETEEQAEQRAGVAPPTAPAQQSDDLKPQDLSDEQLRQVIATAIGWIEANQKKVPKAKLAEAQRRLASYQAEIDFRAHVAQREAEQADGA